MLLFSAHFKENKDLDLKSYLELLIIIKITTSTYLSKKLIS